VLIPGAIKTKKSQSAESQRNKNVLSSHLNSVRQMSCCRSSTGRLSTNVISILYLIDREVKLVDLFKTMELLNNSYAFYMLGRGSASPQTPPPSVNAFCIVTNGAHETPVYPARCYETVPKSVIFPWIFAEDSILPHAGEYMVCRHWCQPYKRLLPQA